MSKIRINKKVNTMNKKAVIFFWPHNRLFKKDGDEFRIQAFACSGWYQGHGYQVDMYAIPKGKKWEKRGFVMTKIEKYGKYGKGEIDRILFFSHGSPKSFGAGFNTKNIHRLAHRIASATKTTATITLFCCLTGKLPIGGLAEALSTNSGRRVFAHKTRGHTTKNPFKRVFFRGKMANLYPENPKGLAALKKHFWEAPNYFPVQFLEGFAVQKKDAGVE